MSPDNPISTIPINPSLDIDTTGNQYVNQSRAYIYIYIYIYIWLLNVALLTYTFIETSTSALVGEASGK